MIFICGNVFIGYQQPASLLDSFCKRINFGGVKAELIPLTEVKGIGKARGKTFNLKKLDIDII